jgi:hypothetical protein
MEPIAAVGEVLDPRQNDSQVESEHVSNAEGWQATIEQTVDRALAHVQVSRHFA